MNSLMLYQSGQLTFNPTCELRSIGKSRVTNEEKYEMPFLGHLKGRLRVLIRRLIRSSDSAGFGS